MAGKIAWYLNDGATTDPYARTRRAIAKLRGSLTPAQAREWAELRQRYEFFDGEVEIEVQYLRAFLKGRIRHLLASTPVQLARYRDPHRITVKTEAHDLLPGANMKVCGSCGIEVYEIRGGLRHSERRIQELVELEAGQRPNPCDCGKGVWCPQYGSAQMVLGGIR